MKYIEEIWRKGALQRLENRWGHYEYLSLREKLYYWLRLRRAPRCKWIPNPDTITLGDIINMPMTKLRWP